MPVDQLVPLFADIAELGGVLELEIGGGGNGAAGGGLGQFAIAQRLSGRRMHDFVVLGLHLRDRHVPAGRRFGFQHLAGGGADAAQRHEMMAHRARTVGVLAAETLFVAGRLQHLEAREIAFQLVGYHHGEAGAHPLPHFGADAKQGHGAVLGDRQEDARIVLEAAGHGVAAIFLLFGGQGEGPAGQNQTAGGEAEQQRAAADVQRSVIGRDGIHDHTPPVAARLMAARMRG